MKRLALRACHVTRTRRLDRRQPPARGRCSSSREAVLLGAFRIVHGHAV